MLGGNPTCHTRVDCDGTWFIRSSHDLPWPWAIPMNDHSPLRACLDHATSSQSSDRERYGTYPETEGCPWRNVTHWDPTQTTTNLHIDMGVSSNRATPSSHPFLDGNFPYKPSIYGFPHLWKPPYWYIPVKEKRSRQPGFFIVFFAFDPSNNCGHVDIGSPYANGFLNGFP